MCVFSCWKKKKRLMNPYCWSTIDNIHHYMDFKKATKQERMAFLEFAIKVVGMDIEGSYISQFIYGDIESQKLLSLFPIDYFTKPVSEIEDFPTTGKTVVTIPYDWSKAYGAILDVQREGFRKEKNYTNGIYIPELDMVIVINGRHHFSAATAFHKKTAVSVKVYSLKDVFPELNVSQDGDNWVMGDKTYPIQDPRFAVLYLMAQELDKLRNREPFSCGDEKTKPCI